MIFFFRESGGSFSLLVGLPKELCIVYCIFPSFLVRQIRRMGDIWDRISDNSVLSRGLGKASLCQKICRGLKEVLSRSLSSSFRTRWGCHVVIAGACHILQWYVRGSQQYSKSLVNLIYLAVYATRICHTPYPISTERKQGERKGVRKTSQGNNTTDSPICKIQTFT